MAFKVYALRNRTSEEVYIGTTTKRLLCDRLSEHRADFRRGRGISSGRITVCPTAYIELLEECDGGKEMRKERERYWIRNTPNCVNQHTLRTEEEARVAANRATVAYHQRNPEAHARYMREWKARRKLTGGA